ncbi:acyl-CoA dehydrogenase [Amycolatopsis sp. RM579]|uniref:Acyl-CoA dehydrogenase n=2 Tax=Amycolatopsis pithecellobii TaxID=664692 RepID=A0A6N7Z1X6_9PSEU|nr:acyl-CoA dehydrogenase [Amycolatopsis pithecellobii]
MDECLADIPLSELERQENPGLDVFRRCGGPALLVPEQFAGLGADPVQAVRVQRAIGARSPSLAVATTMHHFSVASLVETGKRSTGFEWMLLEAIARDRLLVASGFAEGRTGQGILAPTMRAQERGGRIVLNGSKRPCSLARSMDLLTASVLLPAENGTGEGFAIALVPKGTPGLSVKPFWNSFVLVGTQSDEVVLDNVEVPPNLVVRIDVTPERPLDDLQTTGFLWFELLMSASYLGVASALVERMLASSRADAGLRASVLVDVESAMAALESVALGMTTGLLGEAALARALVCRYATQDAVARAVTRCVEGLGGMAYIGADDVAYLAAASAALAFHPPARDGMARALCEYYDGSPMRVP